MVALLLAVSGLSEVPCKILSGCFADRKYVSVTIHVAFYMFLTSVCALLCGLISGLAGKCMALFKDTQVDALAGAHVYRWVYM